MTELNDERWAFVVEWFDSSADLVRQYQLLYYLMDSTLEMVSLLPGTALSSLQFPARAPRRCGPGRAWACVLGRPAELSEIALGVADALVGLAKAAVRVPIAHPATRFFRVCVCVCRAHSTTSRIAARC